MIVTLTNRAMMNGMTALLNFSIDTLAILEATVSRYIVGGEKKIKTLRLLSKTKEQMHKESTDKKRVYQKKKAKKGARTAGKKC